ncbi:MAG: glycosyltransferase family 2 protein [Acidobacteriaceae bacterium]|nr:glycosyltransferase family 2 protein [Acidobacteriaceae bacterium]
MSRPPRKLAITIVTYNSARYIRRCLEWVLAQSYAPTEAIVIDNASRDGTLEILREFESRARVIYNQRNTGFAAAQNQAIALSDADWILTLNPDVRLTPDFAATLIAAAEADPSAGSLCGKLFAMGEDAEIPETAVLDSTGIYFTRNLRHFDRGSREPDAGQYDRAEYVFGATGAAALYRREMIRDVSVGGEFFDDDFFAYREDADVAWRAQLLGWKCLYTPAAVAYHARHALPSNRRSLSPLINMHSVKNRFLMRIKNTTGDLYRRHWLSITLRDLLVVGACLTHEFTSLRAFPLVMGGFRRAWAKRREIMQRRRAPDGYIAAWFTDGAAMQKSGRP